MKSLFLRMFLWFCAANAILISVVVAGYAVSNPDQLPFAWPRVGRGAIVFTGRGAVDCYERGGVTELSRYLEALAQDTGLQGALYDSSEHELSRRPEVQTPGDLTLVPKDQLQLSVERHRAIVRLTGRSNASYIFVTSVPPREIRHYWSRFFMVSLLFTGGLLCYLLARHITSPVVQLRSATSRFSGGDLKARVTLSSVLERKDEIGGLARDFNRMAARIELLLQAQQRLIADVSHELRSPITRLSLALGLMRRRGSDSRTSLARMEREVERLNTLIAQLLTLSRLESLDQPAPMEPVELAPLVQEVAADADFEAANMNRSVQLVECTPCSIVGARDLLRSAVENIVRNALKYTIPDGQVFIRLTCNNSAATVVVEDQGPGVPAHALEHMFEPFQRVDEARDRRSGGAGLGLAITRQIVTLHNGSIGAFNREAGGLEMRITLPVKGTA